jgi:hypothetical protein
MAHAAAFTTTPARAQHQYEEQAEHDPRAVSLEKFPHCSRPFDFSITGFPEGRLKPA